MKKLFVLIVAVISLGVLSINANTTTTSQSDLTCLAANLGGDAVEINYDDLPAAVKQTIESDSYADWNVDKVYKVTDSDSSVYYKVEFSSGDQKKVVKFDANGKMLT